MNPLMTVKDAASFLNVSPMTIYREVNAGTLPHVRIGRSIRFSKEALDAYILNPPTETPVETAKPTTRGPVIRL
jgi:excisionase family DNA binding protein